MRIEGMKDMTKKEKYWKKFQETGKIEYYLKYKGKM